MFIYVSLINIFSTYAVVIKIETWCIFLCCWKSWLLWMSCENFIAALGSSCSALSICGLFLNLVLEEYFGTSIAWHVSLATKQNNILWELVNLRVNYVYFLLNWPFVKNVCASIYWPYILSITMFIVFGPVFFPQCCSILKVKLIQAA